MLRIIIIQNYLKNEYLGTTTWDECADYLNKNLTTKTNVICLRENHTFDILYAKIKLFLYCARKKYSTTFYNILSGQATPLQNIVNAFIYIYIYIYIYRISMSIAHCQRFIKFSRLGI